LAAGDAEDYSFTFAEAQLGLGGVSAGERPRGPLVADRVDAVFEEIFAAARVDFFC
jgi:hypothetical protein